MAASDGKRASQAKLNSRVLTRSMSLVEQIDQNDVPVSANEPGPGHYFAPGSFGFSSMGKQPIAKCPSAPRVVFANTGWKEWEKVVVSKGHDSTNKCRTSPGHPYDVDSGLSKQTTKIGTSLRPDLALSLGIDPGGSPGPVYNVREVADGVAPRPYPKDSLAGKSERFPDAKGVNRLGPGEYNTAGSSLKLSTGRSFGIGRAAYDKVIRPGWEKEGQCRLSSGVGPPLWSELKKPGGDTFGKASRFKEYGNDVPGPGYYRRDERDCAITASKGSVCADTKKPESIKFGKQPKKPRFRIHLAQTTAVRGGWGYF